MDGRELQVFLIAGDAGLEGGERVFDDALWPVIAPAPMLLTSSEMTCLPVSRPTMSGVATASMRTWRSAGRDAVSARDKVSERVVVGYSNVGKSQPRYVI